MLTLAFISRYRTRAERVEDDRSAYSAAPPKLGDVLCRLRQFATTAFWASEWLLRVRKPSSTPNDSVRPGAAAPRSRVIFSKADTPRCCPDKRIQISGLPKKSLKIARPSIANLTPEA